MPSRAFNGVLRFLNQNYGRLSQAEQAEKLALQQPRVSQYSNSGPVSVRWWAKIAERLFNLGYRQGQKDTASRLMEGLVETFGEIPQTELANAIGVSQASISLWLRGDSVPSKANFERLVALHVVRLAEPLTEFCPISPVQSGASWRFYDDATDDKALRELLRGEIGIYVFYDSAGRVTYLGKTTNDLWSEPKQRLRANVNRPFYNPTKTSGVQQGEVARYISAYRIRVPQAVHNLEVLMLRAIPNDLANTNIGKFKDGL